MCSRVAVFEVLIVLEHCVEDGEELSGDGDDDLLRCLSRAGHARDEVGEGGMVSCPQGGDVEHGSHERPAAVDTSPRGSPAAVASDGSEAGEGGDLAAPGVPEFGHVRQQRQGDDGADTGGGLQPGADAGAFGIVGDGTGDVAFDVGDLAVEEADVALDGGAHAGAVGLVAACLLALAILDELSPSRRQPLEGPARRRQRWCRLELQGLAHGGEAGAKEAGKMRSEGKEYVVQDGDVLHFRFNV